MIHFAFIHINTGGGGREIEDFGGGGGGGGIFPCTHL